MKTSTLLIAIVVLTVLGLAAVSAQQTTGVPGAPNATTTIDGRALPTPPAPFGA